MVCIQHKQPKAFNKRQGCMENILSPSEETLIKSLI